MRRRWMLLLELLLVVGLCVWAALSFMDKGPRPPNSIDVKVQLNGARDRAYLYRDDAGIYHYQLTNDDGTTTTLDAADFAKRVFEDQKSRTWSEAVLNVTSPTGLVWVGVGLLGQVLFTGRMVVQWLVSEKESARSSRPFSGG
ncbi:MAG: lipid-A-disaccharide synthase N-terminal domain-containing protein [Tepidisphaeraceae bacterium]